MPCYAFDGLVPVVMPGAFVHPDAVLIGDVVIGPEAYIGPCASLRGDFGRIEIGEGANVQDNCTVHSFPGRTVIVGEHGHVGHGAVLHGCVVGRNALIGMNAVIMDNVEIGEDAMIGAMAFVKAGTEVPAGALWAGSPARQIRLLREEEKRWKVEGTAMYRELGQRCIRTLHPVAPLAAEEPDRQRLPGGYLPKAEIGPDKG
ncbi:phenylacetic acid degradation protein PaaY [Altererythrobacter soli]|uniref:Phenylacetic acid degradation protein PaaY n=1 Tax=Croceibacterium soli TaxID=1739690 RepID=A0A6I4USC4_9SPHN|nr:transferase hexapeptide repeat family protein [Croceibacterium soli]MXP41356.1 phenylacetic acid degradation protein PaaY [Croceibacterium soli]